MSNSIKSILDMIRLMELDEGFNDSPEDLIRARQSQYYLDNGGEIAVKRAKRAEDARIQQIVDADKAEKAEKAAQSKAAYAPEPAASPVQQAAPAQLAAPAEAPKAPKTSFAAPGTAVQTITAPTGISTQPNPLAQQLTTGGSKPPGTIATALGQMPEKELAAAGAPPAQLAAPEAKPASSSSEPLTKDQMNARKAELQGRRAAGNSIGTQQSGFGQLANKEAQITKSLQSAGVDVAKSADDAMAKVAGKLGGQTALKGAGKIISKMIPGVGLAFGTADAIARASSGDWLGAGIAGAGAALSIVPGLGGLAAGALDGINMGRDLAKGSSQQDGSPTPTGTTGDTKLKQLQQMIGAKPDGMMGPDTKAKLQAWQQKQGIKADGLPGPETYGKAGIKESQQSASDSIRNLQERLQLIESKAIIRESLEQTYYLDENYYMYDSSGEQITDLLTISVINEAYENGQVQLLEKGLLQYGADLAMAPGRFLGGMGRGAGQVAKSGERGSKAVAKLANKVGGAKGAGLRTGAAIARNPLKSTAAGAAAGIGAGYLGGKLAGGGETPVTPPGPSGGGGGGDGGGGGGSEPNVQPSKDDVVPNIMPPYKEPELDPNELEELHKLARYIGKFSDPVSAELMGQYNTILPNLPKAKEIPGEMDESIVERYFRKINRKY